MCLGDRTKHWTDQVALNLFMQVFISNFLTFSCKNNVLNRKIWGYLDLSAWDLLPMPSLMHSFIYCEQTVPRDS